MKHSLTILSLLLLCACGTASSGNIVQNGSPCAKAGMIARDTDGDAAICTENGE